MFTCVKILILIIIQYFIIRHLFSFIHYLRRQVLLPTTCTKFMSTFKALKGLLDQSMANILKIYVFTRLHRVNKGWKKQNSRMAEVHFSQNLSMLCLLSPLWGIRCFKTAPHMHLVESEDTYKVRWLKTDITASSACRSRTWSRRSLHLFHSGLG